MTTVKKSSILEISTRETNMTYKTKRIDLNSNSKNSKPGSKMSRENNSKGKPNK